MILNKDSHGSEELQRLTGSYYSSNDFESVEMDVIQAEEELRQIIGDAVFDDAQRIYDDGASSDDDLKFLELVQRPVAIKAALMFFRKNDVSHEESGRKVKVSTDSSDKIPWSWQLNRDDEVHLEAYYAAVESLIRYLNRSKKASWLNSDRHKMSLSLLIRSGEQFDAYFPIQRSERFYFLVLAFIREAQMAYVEPAYGEGWSKLLAENTIPESRLHFAACKACSLLTVSIALKRLPLEVIPSGVIRSYKSEQGGSDSTPATIDDIRTVSAWLEADAMSWLNKMKDYHDSSADSHKFSLFPQNDPKNKFFRT